jgi:hypothetical protein
MVEMWLCGYADYNSSRRNPPSRVLTGLHASNVRFVVVPYVGVPLVVSFAYSLCSPEPWRTTLELAIPSPE